MNFNNRCIIFNFPFHILLVAHNNWLNNFTNVLWLRNFLVAPLSEEFTFRACMMPLLLQSFTPSTAVLITPLFFGVAHFHHMIERLRSGMDMKTAIIISCAYSINKTYFNGNRITCSCFYRFSVYIYNNIRILFCVPVRSNGPFCSAIRCSCIL